jgi:hypothetical protein
MPPGKAGRNRGETGRFCPLMTPEQAYDEPSKVAAEDGEVVVDGPDGVAITLTPDAAIETSQRLLDGGLTAQGQRVARRSRTEGGTGDQSGDSDPGIESR